MTQPSVLLVSDSSDERELYEWGLEPQGFRVSTIPDLSGLRDAVARVQPDVLVLNLRLGDSETWESIEQLQCGGELGLPGVILTGSIRPDAANRDRAALNGCAAFVAKPCTPDALAAVLREVLQGRHGLIITDAAEFLSRAGGRQRPGSAAP